MRANALRFEEYTITADKPGAWGIYAGAYLLGSIVFQKQRREYVLVPLPFSHWPVRLLMHVQSIMVGLNRAWSEKGPAHGARGND